MDSNLCSLYYYYVQQYHFTNMLIEMNAFERQKQKKNVYTKFNYILQKKMKTIVNVQMKG